MPAGAGTGLTGDRPGRDRPVDKLIVFHTKLHAALRDIAGGARLSDSGLQLLLEAGDRAARDEKGNRKADDNIHGVKARTRGLIRDPDIHRLAVSGTAHHVPAVFEISLQAADPVILLKAVAEAVGHLPLAVIGEGGVAEVAVGIYIVVPVIHAQAEEDAVLRRAVAEAVAVEDLLSEVFDVAPDIAAVIPDDDNVHAAVILIRDFLRFVVERLPLGIREDARVVVDVVDPRLRVGAYAE